MRTYNQLKDAVIALVDREDYQVSNVIDSGTTDKADQWISNAVRRFYQSDAARTLPFELFVTGTIAEGADFIPIPADWRETRRIVVQQGVYRCSLENTTADIMFDQPPEGRVLIPQRFAREGARFLVDPPNADTNYTIYYYGTLAPITDITFTTYQVTPDNYSLGRLTLVNSGGSQLFFPTGTTTEVVQADTNFQLEPSMAMTADNTVPFNFQGQEVFHWLLNNAGEILMYWAAVEAALFYDVSDDSLQTWENRARGQLDAIIKEEQRRDGSGTTPRMQRPGLYRTPGLYRGNQRGF